MTWKNTYKKWLTFEQLDPLLKEQLHTIKDNEQALEEAFYQSLTFGTAGIRGEMGPGTNRLNIYTIRKITAGLANYILTQEEHARQKGVVIAYDSRHMSPEFALEAACTLGKYDIQVYLFDQIKPTPVLSFAVRHLRAFSGIMLTASHNPPQYHGYKLYGSDGNQVTDLVSEQVSLLINGITNELEMNVPSSKQLVETGLLKIIGKELDERYLQELRKVSLNPSLNKEMSSELTIVYTPLHGTGTSSVVNGLHHIGFSNVHVVKEQAKPDGHFPTVQLPNPEDHAAFKLAIRDGKKLDAHILLATDPDADRLGMAVKNDQNEYVVLTGNQTGALLLHYLLQQKKANGTLPNNGVVLKTIVTSELGRAIASDFAIETIDLLTGFKYIGEKIKEYEQTSEYRFLFGYEESYGYLIHDAVRDKDAVQAACLATEVAAFYHSQGKTMYDGLLDLFEKYGYFTEDIVSFTLEGKQGVKQIDTLLSFLREETIDSIAEKQVVAIEDYLSGQKMNKIEQTKMPISLPRSNVLKFLLSDDAWIAIRPSGTEPKVKFYFGVKGTSMDDATQQLEQLKTALMKKVLPFIQISEQPIV